MIDIKRTLEEHKIVKQKMLECELVFKELAGVIAIVICAETILRKLNGLNKEELKKGFW